MNDLNAYIGVALYPGSSTEKRRGSLEDLITCPSNVVCISGGAWVRGYIGKQRGVSDWQNNFEGFRWRSLGTRLYLCRHSNHSHGKCFRHLSPICVMCIETLESCMFANQKSWRLLFWTMNALVKQAVLAGAPPPPLSTSVWHSCYSCDKQMFSGLTPLCYTLWVMKSWGRGYHAVHSSWLNSWATEIEGLRTKLASQTINKGLFHMEI